MDPGERIAAVEAHLADLQGQVDRRFTGLVHEDTDRAILLSQDINRRFQVVFNDVQELRKDVKSMKRLLVSLLVSISLAAVGLMLTTLIAAGHL